MQVFAGSDPSVTLRDLSQCLQALTAQVTEHTLGSLSVLRDGRMRWRTEAFLRGTAGPSIRWSRGGSCTTGEIFTLLGMPSISTLLKELVQALEDD